MVFNQCISKASVRDEDQAKHGGLAGLQRWSWQVAATWGPAKIRRLRAASRKNLKTEPGKGLEGGDAVYARLLLKET